MNLKIVVPMMAFAAILGSCKEKPKEEPMKFTGIELSNLDTNINPGTNFFMYANGGWLKNNPMPEEYSRYGAFELLNIKNEEEVKSIIEEISKKNDLKTGSPEQQIRDYYKAAMDTSRIESMGYEPIKPILAEIAALKTTTDVVKMQAKLNFMGSYPFFATFSGQDEKNSSMVIANLYQGGIGLPERDYYTNTDERTKTIQKEYLAHIAKMFQLIGNDEKTALKNAKTVMDIETNLAKGSFTNMELRDPNATYNIYDLAKLQKEFPKFDFATYFSAIGVDSLRTINVGQPKFFANLSALFAKAKVEDLKTYLVWNVINSNAENLSTAFEKQNFYFYSTVFSGVDKMKPRWKRMIAFTNSNLGEPVGKLYVEKYFPAESKDRMVKLVGNLKIALNESIENLDWMSAETKVKAKEKLQTMNLKVGYPNKWEDYSSVVIDSTNFIQNNWNCSAFSYKKNLEEIGKPVDREKWGMTPQTVNAYYSPTMNEIVFPAAILQPPFFDPTADDAVNYGAIGVVIGHEMTHGFDDQGRLYDKNGNLSDWWTPADAENFKAKTQILVEQYNNYKILDSLHVNGELTLGENIADNGGLFIAYAALQKSYGEKGQPAPIDNLTSDQRYLISYAQIWRQHIRPKTLIRRLQEDVHSPGDARVNAGVANLSWWYTAFNVTEKDPNFIAPEKRAKIW